MSARAFRALIVAGHVRRNGQVVWVHPGTTVHDELAAGGIGSRAVCLGVIYERTS